jgi:hypothetical protein
MIFFKKEHLPKFNLKWLFLGIIFLPSHLFAQGNLMIYPKRLVFQNLKRTQELSLLNNGKDTARYVLSVVQIRMKPDGSFQTITQPDSGQRFADKNFRFFPRAVVLAPGESQMVKVQLIKTTELSDGEYRSHLYVRAQKEEKPLGQVNTNVKPSSIAISIVPVFGLSIPIIIKVGESTTKVNIIEGSIKMLKNSNSSLSLKLVRSGNMSVYGDFLVEYISTTGKRTIVGTMQGVAVYSPTPFRAFEIPLDKTKGIIYNRGKLHVSFSEQSGNRLTLADTELALQ